MMLSSAQCLPTKRFISGQPSPKLKLRLTQYSDETACQTLTPVRSKLIKVFWNAYAQQIFQQPSSTHVQAVWPNDHEHLKTYIHCLEKNRPEHTGGTRWNTEYFQFMIVYTSIPQAQTDFLTIELNTSIRGVWLHPASSGTDAKSVKLLHLLGQSWLTIMSVRDVQDKTEAQRHDYNTLIIEMERRRPWIPVSGGWLGFCWGNHSRTSAPSHPIFLVLFFFFTCGLGLGLEGLFVFVFWQASYT